MGWFSREWDGEGWILLALCNYPLNSIGCQVQADWQFVRTIQSVHVVESSDSQIHTTLAGGADRSNAAAAVGTSGGITAGPDSAARRAPGSCGCQFGPSFFLFHVDAVFTICGVHVQRLQKN